VQGRVERSEQLESGRVCGGPSPRPGRWSTPPSTPSATSRRSSDQPLLRSTPGSPHTPPPTPASPSTPSPHWSSTPSPPTRDPTGDPRPAGGAGGAVVSVACGTLTRVTTTAVPVRDLGYFIVPLQMSALTESTALQYSQSSPIALE